MNTGNSGRRNLDAVIDGIFGRALDGPRAEGSAYLEEACGAGVGLLARVERLLAINRPEISKVEKRTEIRGFWILDVWRNRPRSGPRNRYLRSIHNRVNHRGPLSRQILCAAIVRARSR